MNLRRLICMVRDILPKRAIRQAIKFLPGQPMRKKVNWDVYDRANYAYGTYYAAVQARSLGIPKISVIEFGVAGGNGLVALERIAADVEREIGVQIEVYGFDTGEGMPVAEDYRDLAYVWQKGDFKMDVGKLRKRLTRARLILGNISETIPSFLGTCAPVGFVSFDFDYYSSTKVALKLLDSVDQFLLPRVFCYFDDCIGGEEELHSPYAGELLAIEEFNRDHADRKLAKIHGLPFKRIFVNKWNEVMYVLHGFKHPLYNNLIRSNDDWKMPLN